MAETGSKSKTLSDRSSNSKLLDPPTFFLDRALGKRKIADALRAIGALVEVHEDHFPSDARDEDWLSEVGKRGWVVLTKDRHIRYRASEKQSLMVGVQVLLTLILLDALFFLIYDTVHFRATGHLKRITAKA